MKLSRICSARLVVLAIALFCQVASAARAQPLVDGSTITLPAAATQTVTIPAGTPVFNPGPDDLIRTVTATGASTFTVDLSGPTLQLVNGSYFGVGADEFLGAFELLTGPAHGFDPMTMTFENIVGDPSTGNFTADVLQFTVPNYGVKLLTAGVALEVIDSFFFTNGTYDGLPPSAGISLFGDPFDGAGSELPIYIAGDLTTPIGFSSQRLVTTIPEPSSVLILGLSILGLVAMPRQR